MEMKSKKCEENTTVWEREIERQRQKILTTLFAVAASCGKKQGKNATRLHMLLEVEVVVALIVSATIVVDFAAAAAGRDARSLHATT